MVFNGLGRKCSSGWLPFVTSSFILLIQSVIILVTSYHVTALFGLSPNLALFVLFQTFSRSSLLPAPLFSMFTEGL